MTANLITFTLVAFLVIAVPGADFAVVMRNALAGGAPAGVTTACGIVAGVTLHASAAATGLSLVLLASPTAFAVVAAAGAGYLVYLGVRALRAAFRAPAPGAPAHPDAGVEITLREAFRQGLLTNALNPKAVFFFVSLMPQFIPGRAAATGWTALLAALTAAVAFAWFWLVSTLVGKVSGVLARPRVQRGVNLVTGLVFIGLAVRLALSR